MVNGWLECGLALAVLLWVYLVCAEETHQVLLRSWRRISNNAALLETLSEACLHGSFYGAAIFTFFADQVGFALRGQVKTIAITLWLLTFIYVAYEIKRVIEDLHSPET